MFKGKLKRSVSYLALAAGIGIIPSDTALGQFTMNSPIRFSADFNRDNTGQVSLAINGAGAYGVNGNGTTDNNAAFTAMFGNTRGDQIFLPAGTYRLACPGGVASQFNAASGINIWGAGRRSTIIKLDTGCPIPTNGTGMFNWLEVSGGGIHNLGIDLNSNTPPTTFTSLVYGRAYNADVNGWTVENIDILNGAGEIANINAGANNHNFTKLFISNNYINRTGLQRTPNQCIASTSNGGNGLIEGATVINNRCIGTGIGMGGLANAYVAGNDSSGWLYGSGLGIFGNASSPVANVVNSNNNIIGNVVHDSPNGVDSDNTVMTGMELNCYNCIVSNNIAYNTGGTGFVNFGDSTRYVGNLAYNNGTNGSGSPAGPGDQANFSLLAGTAGFSASQGVVMVGNSGFGSVYGLVIQDQGSGFNTGFAGANLAMDASNRFSGSTADVLDRNLQFTNGQQYPAYGINVGTVSGLFGAGIPQMAFFSSQFDTSSYHRFQLTCRNVTPVNVSDTVLVQVGTGSSGGPSWQGAGYTVGAAGTESGAAALVNSTTAPGVILNKSGVDNTQGNPMVFTANFGDMQVVGNKAIMFSSAYVLPGGIQGSLNGSGFLAAGGTGAIVGIRVVTQSGGNLYGSCTLTGYTS